MEMAHRVDSLVAELTRTWRETKTPTAIPTSPLVRYANHRMSSGTTTRIKLRGTDTVLRTPDQTTASLAKPCAWIGPYAACSPRMASTARWPAIQLNSNRVKRHQPLATDVYQDARRIADHVCGGMSCHASVLRCRVRKAVRVKQRNVFTSIISRNKCYTFRA